MGRIPCKLFDYGRGAKRIEQSRMEVPCCPACGKATVHLAPAVSMPTSIRTATGLSLDSLEPLGSPWPALLAQARGTSRHRSSGCEEPKAVDVQKEPDCCHERSREGSQVKSEVKISDFFD